MLLLKLEPTKGLQHGCECGARFGPSQPFTGSGRGQVSALKAGDEHPLGAVVDADGPQMERLDVSGILGQYERVSPSFCREQLRVLHREGA
jgi:hypothetical protein